MDSSTLLTAIAEHDNTTFDEELSKLEDKIDTNTPDGRKLSDKAIVTAIKSDNHHALSKLVTELPPHKEGSEVVLIKQGYFPVDVLSKAVKYDKYECAVILVTESKSLAYGSGLEMAVLRNRVNIVRLLIIDQADKTKYDKRALEQAHALAKKYEREEIVKLFYKREAKTNIFFASDKKFNAYVEKVCAECGLSPPSPVEKTPRRIIGVENPGRCVSVSVSDPLPLPGEISLPNFLRDELDRVLITTPSTGTVDQLEESWKSVRGEPEAIGNESTCNVNCGIIETGRDVPLSSGTVDTRSEMKPVGYVMTPMMSGFVYGDTTGRVHTPSTTVPLVVEIVDSEKVIVKHSMDSQRLSEDIDYNDID